MTRRDLFAGILALVGVRAAEPAVDNTVLRYPIPSKRWRRRRSVAEDQLEALFEDHLSQFSPEEQQRLVDAALAVPVKPGLYPTKAEVSAAIREALRTPKDQYAVGRALISKLDFDDGGPR
jgi:hypothetical protein